MTIVQLSSGPLRGSAEKGIHVFRGIPYAEPLQGAARWLPPQPRRPWSELRDATRYGPACMQFGSRSALRFPKTRMAYLRALGGSIVLEEGDDSLLLNIWTPSVDVGAQLPVMVWIHGGGFTAGAANSFYDAARFARKDVVVVVIQYRLGPPGFLHGSGLFSGELCADNRALLDQVCALQWVQQNIAAFGGNAVNVTLFGESAGAFAIYQLAASPRAKGLFHRAIAMGGMAQTCAPADDYHALTRDVLGEVGVAPGDDEALIALDSEQVKRLQAAIGKRIFRGKPMERYGVLGREKVSFLGAATATEFLPESPLDCYAKGTPNQIDLMLGTCRNDGGLFSLALPLPRSWSAKLFAPNLKGIVPGGDIVKMQACYRREMPDAAKGEVYDRVNNDAFYRMPTIRAAEAHAVGHPGRTYLYQLDYPCTLDGLGAIHGIDVALLFRTAPVDQLIGTDAETDALAEGMLAFWTQFAKTGRPSAPSMPVWQPFDSTTRSTMVLDRASRSVFDPDGHLRRYWR